jgi:RHS repeat-associated protein
VTGAHPGWTSRSFSYDPAGRLLTVEELAGDDAWTCRSYGWDVNSNRTSATTHPAAGDGTCTPTGAAIASQALSYDVADRLLPVGAAAGTGYDTWGRVITQPGGLTATPTAGAATVTYHVNDLVASLVQDGTTRTWTLDPAQRLATQTVEAPESPPGSGQHPGSGQLVNHYSDPATDSPTWTLDTTSGTAVTRRYVPGLVGMFAEITTTGTAATTSVQLTGLHGDVLRTTSPTATGSPDGARITADEFGVIRDDTGTTVPGPRYGWLGGKQRPVDTGTAGLTLMGVRLYAPAIGRFLSVDPVYGGNANTYTYPADPINAVDLDGRRYARHEHHGAYSWARSRDSFRGVRSTGRHTSITTWARRHVSVEASVCVIACLGFSYHNGHVYRTTGVGVFASGGVGLAYNSNPNRPKRSEDIGFSVGKLSGSTAKSKRGTFDPSRGWSLGTGPGFPSLWLGRTTTERIR